MADRTLTISWQDPNELAARAHGSSGLDFLRAIAAGELPRAPIQDLLGFDLIEVEEGASCSPPSPASSTTTRSAPCTAASRRPCSTARWARASTRRGQVQPRAGHHGRHRPGARRGKVIHRGKTVATVEATLRSEEGGALLAHGTSTCLIR